MTAGSLPALAATSSRRLQEILRRGESPDISSLVGWEYHGVNMPATLPKLLRIRRFIKGFIAGPDGRVTGYNKQVVGADLNLPWTPRPRKGGERYAYFAVDPADHHVYRNAVLFDYGAVPEPERGIAALLRDYVVRVEPGSDDVLLGRAFLAAGSRRIPVGWFAIERANRIGE